MASTCRVASLSHSRVRCRSVTSSSPCGTHPARRRTTCGSGRRAPRGSGRPGAARAARAACATTRGNSPRAASSAGLGGVGRAATGRSRPRGARRPRPRAGATLAGARVGVLHVEDRVVVASAGAAGRGRGRSCESVERARQRVAGGVDADGLDEVVEVDDGAGALAHPDRLAVLDQVDQLADEDLEVVVRGRRRTPAHIAISRPT